MAGIEISKKTGIGPTKEVNESGTKFNNEILFCVSAIITGETIKLITVLRGFHYDIL